MATYSISAVIRFTFLSLIKLTILNLRHPPLQSYRFCAIIGPWNFWQVDRSSQRTTSQYILLCLIPFTTNCSWKRPVLALRQTQKAYHHLYEHISIKPIYIIQQLCLCINITTTRDRKEFKKQSAHLYNQHSFKDVQIGMWQFQSSSFIRSLWDSISERSQVYSKNGCKGDFYHTIATRCLNLQETSPWQITQLGQQQRQQLCQSFMILL